MNYQNSISFAKSLDKKDSLKIIAKNFTTQRIATEMN